MRGRAVLLVVLAGCSGSEDRSDLEAFMADVRTRRQAGIDPLPPLDDVAAFAYRASDRRSPFEPSARVGKVDGEEGAAHLTPDPGRTRQYLEGQAIDGISMAGTLSRGAVRYGLVRDADGAVHRVAVGDYLGEDHGRIGAIGPSAIEVMEIVPDGVGGWVGRARTVALETL